MLKLHKKTGLFVSTTRRSFGLGVDNNLILGALFGSQEKFIRPTKPRIESSFDRHGISLLPELYYEYKRLIFSFMIKLNVYKYTWETKLMLGIRIWR